MPQRIPALDGVRGLAVLLVMAYHFQLFGAGSADSRVAPVYSFLSGFGWVGVDLFFVLSGFLITSILIASRTQPDYYKVFYIRRTLRISPLYYASLIVLFALAPASAWAYVLNWQIGVLGWATASTFVAHFWSLCIEEQFYLVWPWCVRQVESRGLAWLSAGLIVASPVLRALFHYWNMPLASYTFTICRADALAMGALLAIAYREGAIWARVVRWAPRALGLTAAGFAVVVFVGRSNSYGTTIMDTIGFTLIDAMFASAVVLLLEGKPKGLPYVLPVLQFFGKYSYGLYVWHPPIVLALAGLGFTEAALLTSVTRHAWIAVILLNAAALALSVAAALVSWHVLEKHFLRLKERLAAPSGSGRARADVAARTCRSWQT